MTITNENLKLQLQIIFNKTFENITPEELASLKSITINSHDVKPGEAEKNVLELLNNCPSLEEIRFIYTYITKKIMAVLSQRNIRGLFMETCALEDESDIHLPANLRNLEVIRCFFDSYDKLLESLPATMETIYFSYPQDEAVIKTSLLKRLPKLRVLILDGCIVTFDELENNDCEYLSLLNTQIDEETVKKISRLPKLNKLFISDRYNGLSGLEEIAKRVEIKNNLIEYGFDNDDEPVTKGLS